MRKFLKRNSRLNASRRLYGKPVLEVEKEVAEFYKPEERLVKSSAPYDRPPEVKQEKKLPIQPVNYDNKPVAKPAWKPTPKPPRREEPVHEVRAEQVRATPVFDNKPAMSLKEALAKALEEKELEKIRGKHFVK